MRVLVVEDEPYLAETIRDGYYERSLRVFDEVGYSVLGAEVLRRIGMWHNDASDPRRGVDGTP